ncbi:PAS domain-containing protein [Sphingomonas sp.]|uniref:PAS domain-containing protein n=1 Tax=Sphingomonas sp. TaxID=28214 RepID=UPI002B9CF3B4|nr:PAS domain-containing protein [Sphingomonas sp.]HTG39000.1 PAS domain-containing protein [Sphingomonas sp.]
MASLVSALHMAEPEVEAMIAGSPIASVISNPRLPDNPIVACNDAFCELTGYDREEIIGRNCRFLAGSGTEPWLTEEIRSGVREQRPVLVEILNYKRDGTPFRNAVVVAPMFDGAGELAWFVGSQVQLPEGTPGPSTSRRIKAAESIKALSERQRQVLMLVAKGLLNKQIAGVLGLSEKTVKMHRAIVMERLGISRSAEMVRLAVEAGL